ncbi:hypothetical protein DFP72DRAFT_856004 [Ephemerocybe angulata]|uniref:Uncharacterized protein n=1 Tax=Ephemerocybe angulata TaxID=980116 RepID=A0A8H6LXK7_9AGAR|nr:hypothetical protein DFP72DRAFT_856004 [Tulosesus angulatus]
MVRLEPYAQPVQDVSQPAQDAEHDILRGVEYIEQQLGTDEWVKTTFAHGNRFWKFGENFRSVYTPPRAGSGFTIGKRVFLTNSGEELEINIFGSVESNARGSQLKATGHLVPNRYNTTRIRDGTTVRHSILIKKPSQSTPKVSKAYNNQRNMFQYIGLREMADAKNTDDTAKWNLFIPKDLTGADGESYIRVYLPPTYKVPPKPKNNSKDNLPEEITFDDLDDDTHGPGDLNMADFDAGNPLADGEGDRDENVPTVQLGAYYDPRLLPDFGGDMFDLNRAKLVQHDIVDTEGNLVAPWELYDKLCPGTIVLIKAKLVAWHTGDQGSDRRTYQIIAERIKIIEDSNELVELREIESFEVPSTPTKRSSGRKTEADNAFDSFQSPSKKNRLA